jgi:hypothetical protein
MGSQTGPEPERADPKEQKPQNSRGRRPADQLVKKRAPMASATPNRRGQGVVSPFPSLKISSSRRRVGLVEGGSGGVGERPGKDCIRQRRSSRWVLSRGLFIWKRLGMEGGREAGWEKVGSGKVGRNPVPVPAGTYRRSNRQRVGLE